MSAARGSDELWLGVICQSNLEIAGSPRNIFRYRVMFEKWGGRALIGCIPLLWEHLVKLRIPHSNAWHSVSGG